MSYYKCQSLNIWFSFILKLSQRIQLHSSEQTSSASGQAQGDANHFHKTFPFFIWLLRDVVLALPKDCHNIKDYFLTRVGTDLSNITIGDGVLSALSIVSTDVPFQNVKTVLLRENLMF